VRQRLVLVSLAVSTMVALAFLIPLALLVRNVARDRALTAGERDAAALAPTLALSTERDKVESALAQTPSGRAGLVTVYLPDGEVIGANRPASADVERSRRDGLAFSTVQAGDVHLFQPVVLPGKGLAVVELIVADAQLRHGVSRSWAALAGVAAVLVAGSVVVADRLAASVVRPTRRLAAAAAELGAGNLDARVDPDGPEEIAEVGTAFNHLAGRIRELLANERELVADLSHRLRTPLTALRLDAEALGDSDAAGRVREDADRLEQAVTSLIAEARRPIRNDLSAQADVVALTAERAAFWAALAEEQGRPWTVSIGSPAGQTFVAVAPDELEAALDALLGNVFAHTPDDAAVAVALVQDGQDVVVTVDDAGPGYPTRSPTERGHSGGGSSGLGLDIVRRAARTAHGRLTLGWSPEGGARAELRLPRL
jgi:signal transduction histidine kinase